MPRCSVWGETRADETPTLASSAARGRGLSWCLNPNIGRARSCSAAAGAAHAGACLRHVLAPGAGGCERARARGSELPPTPIRSELASKAQPATPATLVWQVVRSMSGQTDMPPCHAPPAKQGRWEQRVRPLTDTPPCHAAPAIPGRRSERVWHLPPLRPAKPHLPCWAGEQQRVREPADTPPSHAATATRGR